MQFRGFHIMVFTHPSLSILFSSNSRLPFASISHGCLFLIGFSVRMKTETPTSVLCCCRKIFFSLLICSSPKHTAMQCQSLGELVFFCIFHICHEYTKQEKKTFNAHCTHGIGVGRMPSTFSLSHECACRCVDKRECFLPR